MLAIKDENAFIFGYWYEPWVITMILVQTYRDFMTCTTPTELIHKRLLNATSVNPDAIFLTQPRKKEGFRIHSAPTGMTFVNCAR